MFKVWVNDGQSEMPKDDIFYIVSKEGLFLKKTMGIAESIIPVKNVSYLNPMEIYASLNVVPIPGWQFAQIVYFYKAVYQKFKGEAMNIIHYNQKNGRYLIETPVQAVSGTGVDWDSEKTYKYFDRIGSIHSHADFSAFHSGIDDKDEFDWDGLHITIGNVNSEFFSVAASIVAGGKRFRVKPIDYVEGLKIHSYETVTEVPTYPRSHFPYSLMYGAMGFDYKSLHEDDDKEEKKETKKYVTKKSSGYILDIAKEYLTFPKSWMRRVKKKEYNYSRYRTQGSWNRYQQTQKNKNLPATKPDNISERWWKTFGGGEDDINEYAKVVADEVYDNVYGIPYDFADKGFSGVGNTIESDIDKKDQFDLDSDAVVESIGPEFNPCDNCIHKDERSALMLQEILEELPEGTLDLLGFKEDEDEDDNKKDEEGGWDGY